MVVCTRIEFVSPRVALFRTSTGVEEEEPSWIVGLLMFKFVARTRPALTMSVSVPTGDPAGVQLFGSLKLPVPPNHVCCVGVAEGKMSSEI